MLTQAMNDELTMWTEAKDRNQYAWGWREFYGESEGGIVGNNHGKTFHSLRKVINILTACELSYYLVITENADGEPTPGVAFF